MTHILDTIYTCIKIHGNPSKLHNISLKTNNVKLVVAQEEKSGDHHSQKDSAMHSSVNPSSTR